MLSHIHIKDFAIIEEIDASFGEGLSMITGETGSGKSIIIEAISLALGSRADSTFVRNGKDKALIEVCFDDCPNFVFDLLDEDAAQCENQIIIRRELGSNGKSTCKINGKLVSVSTLREISAHLADIHGQYDHQSLLNAESHIDLLDLYGGDSISVLKSEFLAEYEKYISAKKAYEKLVSNEDAARRELELKKFEYEELKSANLIAGEDEELEERIVMLQNAQQIFSNFANCYNLLYEGDGSILEALLSVSNSLKENSNFNKSFNALHETAEEVYYKLEDLSAEIRRARDKIDFSDEDLNTAVIRDNDLKQLCRKYKRSLPKLIEYKKLLENELQSGIDLDSRRDELKKAYEQSQSVISNLAKKLSAVRRDTAKKLENQIEEQLSQLSFANSIFKIDFESSDESDLSENGIDKVQFLLSANKGESPKPLAKIASGGEMSRIMLAFKKALADFDKIPTMIFDEIDTGISGIAASVVAAKLREISETHQIICITHLPQIAAASDTHYEISKSSDSNSTRVSLNILSHEEKVNEIARLLGGTNITKATIKNAEDLISASR